MDEAKNSEPEIENIWKDLRDLPVSRLIGFCRGLKSGG